MVFSDGSVAHKQSFYALYQQTSFYSKPFMNFILMRALINKENRNVVRNGWDETRGISLIIRAFKKF